MRQLIAGNWKMNGTGAALAGLETLARHVETAKPACDVLICPPATLIARAAAQVKDRIAIGGQDCHAEPSGAFTGDISAEMLRDAGAAAVIVGHSERRQFHAESDAVVAARRSRLARACLPSSASARPGRARPDAPKFAVPIAGSVPWARRVKPPLPRTVWAMARADRPGRNRTMHAHIRASAPLRILYGVGEAPNAREMSLPTSAVPWLAAAPPQGADCLQL